MLSFSANKWNNVDSIHRKRISDSVSSPIGNELRLFFPSSWKNPVLGWYLFLLIASCDQWNCCYCHRFWIFFLFVTSHKLICIEFMRTERDWNLESTHHTSRITTAMIRYTYCIAIHATVKRIFNKIKRAKNIASQEYWAHFKERSQHWTHILFCIERRKRRAFVLHKTI